MRITQLTERLFLGILTLSVGLGCTEVRVSGGNNSNMPVVQQDAGADAGAQLADQGTNENLDEDEDGLTTAQEAALGTDPNKADTDGDGHKDGDEVAAHTDPLNRDDHPYAGGWPIGDCRDDIESSGHSVGQIAEDFSLLDQHGDMVRLHSFCDRVVLIVAAAFW